MTALTVGGMERPPLTHTVKLEDGGEHTVKLSYGLHQDLQRLTPDPGQIVEMLTSDPQARDYVFRRCMTPSKKIITNMEELTPAENILVDDPDEIDALLQWVARHLLYFFATSAGGLKRSATLLQAALEAAQPNP